MFYQEWNVGQRILKILNAKTINISLQYCLASMKGFWQNAKVFESFRIHQWLKIRKWVFQKPFILHLRFHHEITLSIIESQYFGANHRYQGYLGLILLLQKLQVGNSNHNKSVDRVLSLGFFLAFCYIVCTFIWLECVSKHWALYNIAFWV